MHKEEQKEGERSLNLNWFRTAFETKEIYLENQTEINSLKCTKSSSDKLIDSDSNEV